MLDLTKLQQQSIRLDADIAAKQGLHRRPQTRLQNAMVALDVELAEMANTSEWFKVWKIHKGKADAGKTPHETLLNEYVDAMDFFFLVAAIQQWTHLMPMTAEDLAEVASKPKTDLDKQYLAIKHLLYNAYFDHRQESYKHAWHVFLKIGLVEFGFDQDEIQAAFVAKNQVNEARQENDY
ncbi:dUTPase [Lactiplantibacillus mudanjiangensis]|uniref:2-deoxyuridine 5-triphosphate nucleotidohydrolase [Lactobacillus sp.] n=1 Tax=Lactiplantibacillus mudanjiangensis TaxID=1296538 RepID=A0A660E223_9LACO|nr:dUTPase [Lactiplantibacillus mudanjiangensis]VDG19832.1 2-deoxyuridine 5-triphosphate nucleotidohydrolase [Lactobacillus sp.] [Lactiplantibacillus mudanjiangensis]VDG25983.1 2-deoxyuridine 5-triphosphate nucleotidohydrolase [Lactobacillus sp.] [Lactiplantibacillus mudanjiangensis]VDG29779.1 2-deoxyuridine 5-triphosphate nucleotidohydrolase [Lactobacillus sp.] [Lactiplantibacillus mudanjiangensis]